MYSSMTPPLSYVGGLASVGNDTVKHAAHFVRELDNQGNVFFFFSFGRSPTVRCRVRSFVRGGVENLPSTQGE